MSQQRRSNNNLNSDQRFLLETYVMLFNQTNRQMDTLREIQRGIIQDIRAVANLQTNNNNHNARNRNNNSNAQRDYARRNYYGPTNAQEQPFSFEFFPNTFPNTNRTNYVNTLWNNFDNLYANVIVRPTTLEIQTGTRNILFSQIENPLNSNCPISLEPFDPETEVTQISGCGHIFHTDSLNSWFHRNVRCPVCRYDIRTPPIHVQENREEIPHTVPSPVAVPSSQPESEVTDISNNDVVDSLTNLTENILTQLLNPTNGVTRNHIRFHRSTTQVSYDPSSNEIIFRGFY
jgi:hypothetical protein